MFQLDQPDPNQGYFVILSAEDSDGDGLTDGYEAWFTYNGRRTNLQNDYSDLDHMRDGWEVEYGLDPTDATANNGDAANPDGDAYNNQAEHDHYYGAPPKYDATYDPLIAAPSQRPVVTVTPADPPVLGFVVKRDVVLNGSKNALTVYYALGGSARYGAAHDYKLWPTPDGLPRIGSVDIPIGADSVTVTITPTPAGLAKGPLSVVVALTPYSVSAQPQEPNPLNWAYVVDWNDNRATNYFAGKTDGFMINLHRDPITGYLTIQPTASTATPPFVNVANSGRGTVARIEVPNQWDPSLTSSRVVGEYYTTPNGGQAYGPGDPSRTTVDRYGNVWVANRSVGDYGTGSVAKIGVVIGGTRGTRSPPTGPSFTWTPDPPNANPPEWLAPPFIYNTCVDRDGDGLIHTSHGLGDILPWADPALPKGDGDEAVTYYFGTTPNYVRSIAVGADNNVWVGSREINGGNGWQELLDATTGAPITGQKYHYGSGGYGGVMDPFGVLWSSGNSADGVLRLDPRPLAGALPGSAGGTLPSETSDAYGIGLDPTSGDVWAAEYTYGGIWQFKQSGCYISWPFATDQNPERKGLKGVVVDGSGNIWVAHAGLSPTVGQEVYRFRNTGEYLGSVGLSFNGVAGNSPHGVSIDSSGKVWAACYQPAADGHCYAMRIDPTITQGSVGTVVEAADLGVSPSGSGPYNYSDMTGFVSLAGTQPAGVWDFVEDSAVADTLWSSVTLDGDLNSGNILVEVRAADQFMGLTSWPFRQLNGSTGTIPFGAPAPKGRYLETRVTLLQSFGAAQSPILRSLSLAWGAPASDLQITRQPKSQILNLGANNMQDPFSVSAATVTVGTTLSYQWFKDGVAVPNGVSSTLTVNNAHYSDAGLYHVLVQLTDAHGTTLGSLQSADARLHVNSTPTLSSTPTTTEYNGGVPGYPVLGQPAYFDASMDVTQLDSTPSPGPVYYQWRKHGVPIPGQRGTCTTSDGHNYNAGTYTISIVDCPDTASYSVVFTNDYWKVASAPAAIAVVDGSGVAVPPVTLNWQSPPVWQAPPATITVANGNNPLPLTASACFNAVCWQWYHADTYGTPTAPIPGATGPSYTFLPPVPCGNFTVRAFDAGHIPYDCRFTISGDCQP